MPSPLSETVARVGRALLTPDLTDGQLVGRFARSRDGEAFAALVRRHGPMVLGVCRRVAGDHHLADDAFQATFLVLARRAADVTPREAVRAWLYGVAVRTAREARSMSARRRSREVPVAAVPDRASSAEPSADVDALRALDEEIGRLPDHLRAAVVLCELDGLSRKDAATRLGVPEGTLSSRLAKARKLLAGQLRGRGVALAAAATITLPDELAARTVAAVMEANGLSITVSELSRKVVYARFAAKLKRVAVGVAATLVACGLTAVILSAGDAPKPPPAAATRPAGPNRLLVANGDKLVLIDPDKRPGEGMVEAVGRGWAGTLSPDGRWLATQESPDGPLPKDGPPPRRPVVRRLDRKGAAVVIPKLDPAAPDPPRAGVWSADAARLLVEQPLTPARSDGWHERVGWWLFDPATGEADRVPVDVPTWHTVLDWSPDGRTFLTMHYVIRPGKPTVVRLALVPRAGGKPEFVTPDDRSAYAGRFSPDGKRLLFTGAVGEERTGYRFQLFVMNLADRKPVRISDPEKGDVATSCCWSPDGKRVAYVRKKLFYPPDPKAGGEPGGNFAVVVADADGRSPKVVTARSVIHEHVAGMAGLMVRDWR